MTAIDIVRNRREENAAATRQDILDKAAYLFARQGYANTSLADITDRAGVTKGALYHHFFNKEELYAACFTVQARKVAGLVANVTTSDDAWLDALEQCRAFLGCANMLKLNAVPIQEAITVLGWSRWRDLDSAHTMGVLKNTLERLNEAGRLGEFDLDLLADSVYGLLVNAMMSLSTARNKSATKEELMRQLGAFLSGVMNR